MSALGPFYPSISDMTLRRRERRFGPIPEVATVQSIIDGCLNLDEHYMLLSSTNKRYPALPFHHEDNVMPVISGFGAFAELPWERIIDKIERRVLAGLQGMIRKMRAYPPARRR